MRLLARTQKKQWSIQPADDRAQDLARQLKLSPILAQILINRQIHTADQAKSFIYPKLVNLIEPLQMPGAADAIERIKQAINSGEKITIYGDYDVDGITGVTILFQLLNLFDAKVDYYIPHRIDEGYGLNEDAISQLAQAGTSLIITVDCGVTALDSARLAKKLGVDLIITDHHQPSDALPEAVAIVHPLLDESYPNPHSAGAMVAFKLAWALANEFKAGTELKPELREFLIHATGFAAMGTVADVVDLRGENRIITSFGLKALVNSKLCGLEALIASAGLAGQDIDSYHVGFRLGPLLNAAGRMGHARLAVELLTSDNQVRATRIAEYLNEQNKQRQQRERKIFKQACEMITQAGMDHPDRKSIVLANESWHAGIIGIVASRIIDKYYRPTILLNIDDGISRGSGRSVPGFDILEAIKACSEYTEKFGGHSMAAGVTIKSEKIGDFTVTFEEFAQQNLTENDTISRLNIDSEISIGQLTEHVVRELKLLGPFGQGNPNPLFATSGVSRIAPPRRVGPQGKHLQLAVSDNTGSVRCIGFGMGQLEKKILEAEFFSIAYEPAINNYNGNTSVEFVLKDIQFEQS